MQSQEWSFHVFLLFVISVCGLNIDVNSHRGSLGLTMLVTLEVKCSVPPTGIPGMDRLLYLMLSSADHLNSPEFLFLASVHDTDRVLQRVPGNGTADGVIKPGVESFIRVGLTLQGDRLPGAYRCHALGVNKMGDSITVGTYSETKF